MQSMPNAESYPYSLSPALENAYLVELLSVLDVAAWRADEIEVCLTEQRRKGTIAELPFTYGGRGTVVSSATRLLGSIEAFLAAYARASLLVDPPRKKHAPRGLHLRTILRVSGPESRFGLDFGSRDLRDGWMHLDEDISRWAEDRSGAVLPTAITNGGEKWYELALRGSVRIVDADQLSITLPRRGAWLLKPYFHRCSELRDRVLTALSSEHRWKCENGICGIPIGRSGRPERWYIRSIGTEPVVEVHATSYREVVRQFKLAVAALNSRRDR